jgi:hypothetical protein
VFCYDNSGTLALETLDWASDTARATALALSNGVLVKNGDTTRMYLGTGRTTTASGQTEDSLVNRLLWNYYNRVSRRLLYYDGTTHTYNGATYRQWNNSAAAQVALVTGYVEDAINISVGSDMQSNTAGTYMVVATGLDSTTTPDTDVERIQHSTPANNCDFAFGCSGAKLLALGYHYLALIEYGGATATNTFGLGKLSALLPM